MSWTRYEPDNQSGHEPTWMELLLFCILLCGTDVPFMDNTRAIKSTMKEITWRFKIVWEKLALLHFQDFDSSQLHAEPRLLKVLNGFPSIGAMRQAWRLARNDTLPAAFRMLCNINDEYIASGKHPSKIYVSFDDVVLRIANWRNNPFFDRFTLRRRLLCKTPAPTVLARRRPFAFAPDADVALDPCSPSICTDIRNLLKFMPFESVPLNIWVSLDGLAIRKALRVAAVQFRGAITRWAFIRTSWGLLLDNCVAHAWTTSWHLAVPLCALCGYSCGRRQRLLLPLQHAKCTVVASSQLVIDNVHTAIADCDAILTTLKSLLAKVSG